MALTSEPDEILDFLGLDSKVYWKGSFRSFGEMFEYVARCRMFVVSTGDVQTDRASLTANDRKRMIQRPNYKLWVEEFIPACRKTGRFLERRTSREEVTKEALARFNADYQYEERRRAYRLEKQKEHIWTRMIKMVTPPAEFATDALYRGCSTKALKRAILEGSEEHVGGPFDFKNEDGFYDESKVQRFLEDYAEVIGRGAYEAHRAAHRARKEKQANEQ